MLVFENLDLIFEPVFFIAESFRWALCGAATGIAARWRPFGVCGFGFWICFGFGGRDVGFIAGARRDGF
jgi:hypothetical protein